MLSLTQMAGWAAVTGGLCGRKCPSSLLGGGCRPLFLPGGEYSPSPSGGGVVRLSRKEDTLYIHREKDALHPHRKEDTLVPFRKRIHTLNHFREENDHLGGRRPPSLPEEGCCPFLLGRSRPPFPLREGQSLSQLREGGL